MVAQQDWKAKGEAFKASVTASIPSEWLLPDSAAAKLGKDVSGLVQTAPLLTDLEKEITALDATALRDAIAARKYTSVAVTTAYAKAAALAHQTTNCLMAYFVEEALERARWLDAELERTGKPVGPLHGVPISVKDHMGVKGKELIVGFVGWIGTHVSKQDATIVACLRDCGANFIVKTTMPQGGMHIETDSFLGPTTNPHNRALTCGGSSGGEAALIAAGASALGIGSDIGGSIRAPAAVSGIYGFKVTSVRLPVGGFEASFCGQESILPATGPMARSARDMELFIQCVLDREPWKIDNSVVRMLWRPDEVKFLGGAKPRIGVMWDDGLVTPQPPTRRALSSAVEKLKAAGFEVVEFAPYKSAEALEILIPLYFTDGGDSIRRDLALSGEPAHPMTSIVIDTCKRLSMEELWAGIVKRETFRDEVARYWNDAGIDVVLCPPSFGPAQKVGTTKYWNYTCYWNCKQ